MENIIIGTAGHIDHGKTTLIKYLTGKDTDTLPEEKKRGITIDIGFSFLNLDNEKKVGIVDVPGHEKFIKNMVSGVSGIDYVLLLIAADDGIMPQTEEHLNIIKLLNVQNGVIILTKTDLVSPEILAQREKEISKFVKGTFLENSKIFKTSIKDENSFIRMKEFLVEDIKRVEMKKEEDSKKDFRMYVDRCFSVKGFGTVVTGTVLQGEINLDDTCYIYPQNIKCRIKGIENHGLKLNTIRSGNRCALNISQIDKNLIKRGNIISTSNFFPTSNIIDVIFEPLKGKKIKNNQRIRLHIGTREVIGRIKIFKENERFPAQLILEDEITALYGELGIIRNFSPLDTLGGVKILNILGKKIRKNDLESIEKLIVLDEKGEIQNKKDHSLILEDVLNNFHKENYILKGILRLDLKNRFFPELSFKEFKDLLDENIEKNRIKIEKISDKEFISLKDFKVKLTKEDKLLKEKIFKVYKGNGLIPEKRSIIENDFKNAEEFNKIHEYLLNEGMIVYLSDDYYILRGFFKEIQNLIRKYFETNDSLEISDFRKLVNVNRNLAILILEKLDNIKFTKRSDATRVLEKE